ncbi:uncharacterized protein LOC105835921 isoform X2 [Monomorium pharaonis]|uniref:uncharacterized protein LOC105835921 isoform X2 n=1 Tax=Monomorium pharaonis TaxID=307658 RepID=UPI001747D481|nr:uncharacterized protein LOC105835921 isoform X2 [Monomorium pharaonis]
MKEVHEPVHDNFPSIEHTLRPISYTSWFMGVGIARPLKCPKYVTIVIRIIHLVLCTAILITYSQYLFISYISVYMFKYILDWMSYVVSGYYYIYHGIRQYDKWPELMDKMMELDRKIRRETYMNDQPVKNMEAIMILMTFICCPVLMIMYSVYYYMFDYDIPTVTLLLYYMIAQSLIISFVFDIVVYVLYYRYQTINKLISHLDNLSDASLMALKIRHIRELHNDICDNVIMINDIHGLHLLLCSANCFCIVATSLFNVYLRIEKEDYQSILIYNMESIIYFMQFGLICWICTLARQEFDKTKIIICRIGLKCKSVNFDKLNDVRNQLSLEVRPPLEDADSGQNSNWSNNHDWNYVVTENLLGKILDRDHVRNEINDFLIQLQQRQVSFTACNFFEINNNLFCGFVGVIFTYIIVLIQFKHSDNV